MENKKTCSNCTHDLDVGMDVIRVEEGVIGTKGFIPLEKVLYFCCEKCLSNYYDTADLPSIPWRLP